MLSPGDREVVADASAPWSGLLIDIIPPRAPAKSLLFQGFCETELDPSAWKCGGATSPGGNRKENVWINTEALNFQRDTSGSFLCISSERPQGTNSSYRECSVTHLLSALSPPVNLLPRVTSLYPGPPMRL